jgi:nucleotide-binding universal stress UspA family protein
MTETLIVGVDGSDPSKRAVDFALRLASDVGLSLVIAHVIPWSPYSFNTPSENEERAAKKKEELDAATSQIVEPAVAVAAEAGQEVTQVVRHGDPVDVLVEMATEFSAAAIVVGRTGDSRVKRALFGSIPGHLVHESPIPVMVVP